MDTEFEVTGLFYKINGYKLRKHLDIQQVDTNQIDPDLMVVMMNPGSSYPLDRIDDNYKPATAKPDNTQNQIMEVMKNTSLSYARILNLSDLRTPHSRILYKFVKSQESKQVDHSIFSASREVELKELFVENVPVIYGWGVNPALVPLAKQAIEALEVECPMGILKPNTKYTYYHPLPRVHQKRVEWVQHVTNQITRPQQSCAGV